MIDETKLYRLRQRPVDGSLDALTVAELVSAIFAEEPAVKPKHPRLPSAEWYCPNEDCAVREVRVSAKYLDGPPPQRPPRMRCPSCGAEMAFHHYLESKMLLPQGT